MPSSPPWLRRSTIIITSELDLFAIAAGYAYHTAESQAFLDGNKRAVILAELTFLEANGVNTESVDTFHLHVDMLSVASRQMTNPDLVVRFRSLFARSGQTPD